MRNSTITGNKASEGASGIYREGGSASVFNSIVVNNANYTPAITNYSSSIAFSNSCTWPLPAGDGNIEGDPLFMNPGSDYGSSHVLGDYRLTNSSPCIDTGSNAFVPAGMENDLDGNPRIVKASKKGLIVDMGAYEAPCLVPTRILFLMR